MAAEGECLVSGELWAVLRVSRLLGLAPLRCRRARAGLRVRLARTHLILTRMLVVTLSMFVAYFVLVNYVKARAQITTFVQQILWVLKVFLSPVTVIIIVWGAPRRMTSLITSLNTVKQIHADLNVRYEAEQLSKTQRRCLWGWIIFDLLRLISDEIHIALVMKVPHDFKTVILANICNFLIFITHWYLTLATVLFMSLVHHVRAGFKAVNYSSTKLLEDNKTSHEMIPRICASYGAACDCVRAVDSAHGLMLLAILTTSFIGLVATPYYFIPDQTPLSYIHFMKIFLDSIRCFAHLITIIIIVEPCEGTDMEMGYTRELVNRLMQRAASIHDPLAAELQHFCKVLDLNQVYYAPLSIIHIKRGLILTIIASTTTYLMIVIDIIN